jgi:hypothetical protein
VHSKLDTYALLPFHHRLPSTKRSQQY